MWQRPAADAVSSSRIITGFKIEVEGDLVFYKSTGKLHPILHLVDRGTRWAAGYLLNDKTTSELVRGLGLWLGISFAFAPRSEYFHPKALKMKLAKACADRATGSKETKG